MHNQARLYLEDAVPGGGPLEYERCPSCRAPLEAARALSWDLEEGVITNKLTGEREVVVAVQSMNAILRELENELGKSVLTVIYETQKAIEAGHLQAARGAVGETSWEERLEGFAIRGLGYPLVFEATDGCLNVEIANAYNQILYAAKLAAALEYHSGGRSSIKWRTRTSSHGSYTISVEQDRDSRGGARL